MIHSLRIRDARATRAVLAMLTALAVVAFSFLGTASAHAVGDAAPAAPASAAPKAEAVDAESVRLEWADSARSLENFFAYRVDVLAETGDTPLRAHRFGDANDERIAEVRGGWAQTDRIAATVSGLSADTAYRFRVVAVAADGVELATSDASEIVRTLVRVGAEGAGSGAPGEGSVGAGAGDDAGAGAGDAPASEEPEAAGFSAFGAAPFALDAPTYPAPKVTVRGATAVEVDDADFRGSLSYPTIRLEFQNPEGAVVKTVSAGLTASVTVASALTLGASYRVQAVLYEYDDDFNQVETRRSELTPLFTMREVAEAPGVIPAVPTLEPVDGSQMRVSWPAVEDGGDVRTYTVRLYDEAGALLQTKTGINPFTAGTQHTFIGLSALTGYTATVQAIGFEIGTPQLNGAESEKSALAFTLKGVPGKPGTPVLTAGASGSTDIVASWDAPASGGGYPVASYDLEFYTGASASTGGLIAKVRVPGNLTTWTFTAATHVEVPISAVVIANNQAGASARSGFSDTATAAKSPVKATATPKTAPSNANSATGIQLTAPTDDGFTVTWTLPTGVNAPVAGTGYLIRVVEHLASNAATNTSYTYVPVGKPTSAPVGQINAYGIVDAGTFAQTTGRLSATLTGLDGGKTYRVSVTPYVETAGVRAFRVSSSVSAASITTTGSGVPAAGSKAKAPVATGVDALSWTGDALTGKYTGGSPITGYRVAVFLSGQTEPLQVVDATLDGDGVPSAVFTGLTRGTAYQVAYAGVNANGTGPFSEASIAVATLSRPVPGSVAPLYASAAELRAGIARAEATEVPAATAGVTGRLESGTAVSVNPPFDSEELGEVWLYPAEGAPIHQTTFTGDGSRAAASWQLGDLPSGEYLLLFVGDGGEMVAVAVTVLKPVIGRTDLTDAVFRWGFNDESSNGAFFGGCNYFVAGKAPDVGSAQVFTQSRYSSKNGNVTIVKPNAAGEYVQASWETKCLTRSGVPVTSSVTTPVTEQQIVIAGGTGWVDPSTRSAEIRWEGDFTVVYYGGLTFWYASDPVLTVENGVGRVTATVGGYGADMDDLSKWEPLADQQVTLAVLHGVQMTSTGFTVTPDYLGVAVSVAPGGSAQAVPQPTRTADNAAYWGAFPQDFVDFQQLTGQSAYWYTSGGAQDRGKPTLPLTVVYSSILDETGAGEGSDGVGVAPPEAIAPPAQSTGLGRPVANTTVTSIESVETLRELIASGVVTQRPAAEAGIPGTVKAGELLKFSLPWSGEDASGVIWLYPDVAYAGTFRVVNGVVTVTLDSSVIGADGESFAVFFGDAGTTVAVPFTVSGRLAAQTTTPQPVKPQDAAELLAQPLSDNRALLLWLAIGGGLVVLAGAGAGGVVALRRRAAA